MSRGLGARTVHVRNSRSAVRSSSGPDRTRSTRAPENRWNQRSYAPHATSHPRLATTIFLPPNQLARYELPASTETKRSHPAKSQS